MSEPIDLSQMPIILGSEQDDRKWHLIPTPAEAKIYAARLEDEGWQFLGTTTGPVIIEQG